MKLDSICICYGTAALTDKILECKSGTCESGTFFHLTCFNYRRMPNNSSSWVCSSCFTEQMPKSQCTMSKSQQYSAQSNTTTQPNVSHPNATAHFTTSQSTDMSHPTASQPSDMTQLRDDVVFVKTV